jgi:hypothetical protein
MFSFLETDPMIKRQKIESKRDKIDYKDASRHRSTDAAQPPSYAGEEPEYWDSFSATTSRLRNLVVAFL